MPAWLLKWLLGYVVDWLVAKVGHSATAEHVECALSKHVPLPPDITPAQSRNPNQTNHYGGL